MSDTAGLITAVAAGVLGIAGTLAGSVMTTRASTRALTRAQETDRGEARRHEFRVAMTEFCTAIAIYRGAELDRWDARNAGAVASEVAALTARIYATRTAARDALYRVELSTASQPISQAVRQAFDLTKNLKYAPSSGDLSVRSRSHRGDHHASHRVGTP